MKMYFTIVRILMVIVLISLFTAIIRLFYLRGSTLLTILIKVIRHQNIYLFWINVFCHKNALPSYYFIFL